MRSLAPRCPYYPYDEGRLILNTRFTPSPLEPGEQRLITKEDLDNLKDFDGGYAYHNIFNELWDSTGTMNYPPMICSSDEIGEDLTHGDFLYCHGNLLPGVYLLFMESTHPWALPSRLILYDQKWQYEVATDRIAITISPVDSKIYQMMADNNSDRRNRAITEFLKHTERPVIFDS